MLLFNRLRTIDSLSDSEKMIAQFVLDRPREVIDMNIDEFANLNYVSNLTSKDSLILKYVLLQKLTLF